MSSSPSSNVNVLTAYLLWFFFGIFGLHHAYLHRPYQGLAWYATSGLFGFGLLRDLYRIPTYVSLCRDDRTNNVAARVRDATVVAREGAPNMSFWRIVLMVVFGTYFGFVASCLVIFPQCAEEGGIGGVWWTVYGYGILRAMGAAAGIWLVGNMGEETIVTIQGSQKREFMSLAMWCTASMIVVNSPVLGGVIYAVRRRRYRPSMSRPPTNRERELGLDRLTTKTTEENDAYSSASRRKRTEENEVSSSASASRRIGRHLLTCAVFTAILTIAACNHGSIIVNGNRVYLYDALRNAVNSGFWHEFDWKQFREEGGFGGQRGGGGRGGNEYLKRVFDVQGERAARRTLGVARDASHSEVRSAYKKLALKYHPDKIGSDATGVAVEEANRQFVKVQEAYEVLNDIEQARKKREAEAEELYQKQRHDGGDTTTGSSSRGSGYNSRGERLQREEM